MSKSTITNQTSAWEIKNSRWIIASFFMMAWGGFLYIGAKTKQKKWLISGVVYAVLFGVIFFISGETNLNSETGGTAYDIYAGFFSLYYIVSIIHSFLSRKEYLLRLEAIQIKGKDELKNKIQKEYFGDYPERVIHRTNNKPQYILDSEPEIEAPKQEHTKFSHPCPFCGAYVLSGSFCTNCGAIISNNHKDTASPVENNENAKATDTAKIDINTCSESDLEKLPGISVALAKKLIDYRNKNGDFADVDEFFKTASLKPHFVAQLRDKLSCSVPSKTNGSKTPDRKLDF